MRLPRAPSVQERSLATQFAEMLVQYELIEEVEHLTYRRLRERVRGTAQLERVWFCAC